jgi:hypothetical protein
MDRILPTFLIVGAAKSGTSSLWHYLKAHPEVFVPEPKEVNFFNDVGVFSRGVDWYASLFAPGAGKKAIGEASPSYLYSEESPARMAEIVPRARLIAILRNPIDRAHSHYLHARYYGLERRSFREAVADEVAGQGWPFYLGFGRYHPQLVKLSRFFPREQLLVLLLDDLIADPVGTFKTLCGHLGIDERVVPGNVGEVTNTYREPRAAPFLRFVIRTAQRGRLPRRLWRPAVRLATREGRTPPPLEPDLRRELTGYFAEDNDALASWLGRDLDAWA